MRRELRIARPRSGWTDWGNTRLQAGRCGALSRLLQVCLCARGWASKRNIWPISATHLGWAVLLALAAVALLGTGAAQAVSPWSEPVVLNEQDAATPFLLADASGTLHALWGGAGLNGDKGAIFYRRLVDGEWSETVDILAPPAGNAALHPSAVIDAEGYIHLVWVSDKLYYSRAHVSQALNPRGWSAPYQMTNSAVASPVIILGADGSLNVLFASQGATPAAFLLKSDDGGDFWRVAVQVSFPQDGAYTLSASLAVDSRNRLHAAWDEARQGAALAEGQTAPPPAGVFYARSDDGGAHWSYPQRLANGEQGQPAIAADGRDGVHLFWSGSGAAAGKYHAYLDPLEAEWQTTERLLPGAEGLLGPTALAVDSSGRLQVALALTSETLFTQPSPGEIIALSWWEGRWADRIHASLPVSDAQVEQSYPALAVAGGNTLHLLWLAADQRGVQADGSPVYLYYAARRLGANPLELQPLPTLAVALPTPTSQPSPTPIPLTPTPWVVDESGFLPHDAFWYRPAPLLFGGAIALTLLILAITLATRKRKHVP